MGRKREVSGGGVGKGDGGRGGREVRKGKEEDEGGGRRRSEKRDK